MLGEFKSDHLLVEKAKLGNKFYAENQNHLSWHKSPIKYMEGIVSKITKENICFKF